jgi:threonine dehydrogenase-like Zn-dependent dehydrogenase
MIAGLVRLGPRVRVWCVLFFPSISMINRPLLESRRLLMRRQNLGYLGGTIAGGFAEQISVKEEYLHVLPDDIDMDHVAVVEPLAVVVHAIKQANISDWSDQQVLILGGGPVGFALAVALQSYGAKNVYVSEPASRRREQIAEFVTAVFDPVKQKIGEECLKASSNHGIDVVFDCAGVQVGVATGFEALRFQSTYIMVAIWERPVSRVAYPQTIPGWLTWCCRWPSTSTFCYRST